MVDRTCLHCGVQFDQLPGPGAPRRWCYSCLPALNGGANGAAYNRLAVGLDAYARTGKHGAGCCPTVFMYRSPIGPRLSEVRARPMRHCVRCGAEFVAKQDKHKACSANCGTMTWRKTAAGKAYKKRHSNNNVVNRRERIAARDKHRCALCGKRVDMALPFPNLFCATLDHVVPRALGGGDDDANLQLAHFLCNATKNDGYVDGGEQMRLI